MSEYLPYIDARLRVGWVEGLGHGIFTTEDIEKNTFVELAPVVICQPEAMKDPILSKYVILWNEQVAMGLGWTMMYNHSDKNCCEFSCNHHDGLMAILTVRDVKAGEQLTVNYGPNWFSSREMEKVCL
jgi:hypothetical protein